MTTEPRQEAEGIVHRTVTQAITTGSNAHVVDDTRLVDALAAAIEWFDKHNEMRGFTYAGEPAETIHAAANRAEEAKGNFGRALSALREGHTHA